MWRGCVPAGTVRSVWSNGNAFAPGTPGVYQTISRGREVFTWVLQKSFGVLFLLAGVFLLGR
jgi:hypothetical protein